jgi:hypothetical protein
MSLIGVVSNTSIKNPSNLYPICGPCNVTWDQEELPYFQNLIPAVAKARPLEIINYQSSYSVQSSLYSATVVTTPGARLVIGVPENIIVSCPEIKPFDEKNWVLSVWDEQFVYQPIPHQIKIGEGYRKAIDKISGLQNLGLSWDSFHGKKIDSNCISRARKILIDLSEWEANIPSPFVAPRSDGSIQMEWEVGTRYLELGFVPDSSGIEFLAMDEDRDGNPIEFEGTLEQEESIIKLLQWFIHGDIESVTELFSKIE